MKETETKTQIKEQPAEQSKGKKILKAILNTIINILIVLILITSVLIATLALTSKANGGISNIFGYTIQPIQSDSMKGGSPDGYGGKEFAKGDLMIAKATNNDESAVYDLGDIVTFKTEDGNGNVMLIAHRIVDVHTNDDGKKLYQTQGDNREMAQVPDQDGVSTYLSASDICSVYYTSDYEGTIIKGVGSVIDYLQSQQGFFFVVLLPMIIFFMYALIRVVLSAAGYKKSKSDEEKDEAVKAAVAAALAEKESGSETAPVSSESSASTANTPSGMTPEELEQFRQFQEFQKMQKAQQEAAENKPETPTDN